MSKINLHPNVLEKLNEVKKRYYLTNNQAIEMLLERNQILEKGLISRSYKNGDWEYKETIGYYHIFRNGKELLPEVKKTYTFSFSNGDWEYTDTAGYEHLFRDGKELLPEIKKRDIFSYTNGDWEYTDTNGKIHTIKGDKNE